MKARNWAFTVASTICPDSLASTIELDQRETRLSAAVHMLNTSTDPYVFSYLLCYTAFVNSGADISSWSQLANCQVC